jgi:hypothetical protein
VQEQQYVVGFKARATPKTLVDWAEHGANQALYELQLYTASQERAAEIARKRWSTPLTRRGEHASSTRLTAQTEIAKLIDHANTILQT